MTKLPYFVFTIVSLWVSFSAFAQNHSDTLSAQQLFKQVYLLKDSSKYDQALLKAEEAQQKYLQTATDPDTLLAGILYIKGVLQYNLSDYNNGIRSLNQSFDIYKKYDNHGRMADCYLWIGNATWYLKGSAEALNYFTDAVAAAEKDEHNTRFYRGRYYTDKGYAHLELSQLDSAKNYITKGLDMDIAHLGEAHSQTAESYRTLATYYSYTEDYFQAIKINKKVEQIFLQVYSDKSHANIGALYGDMGRLSLIMSNFTQSLEYYHKALAIFQKRLPSNHPNITHLYSDIGMVYSNIYQNDKALHYFALAAARVDTTDKKMMINIQQGQGHSYRGLRRFEEAYEMFSAVLSESIKQYGPQTLATALCYENLANVSVFFKDGEVESRQHLRAALNIYKALFPTGHPSFARIYTQMAVTFLPENQLDSMLYYYNNAVAILNMDINDYANIKYPDLWFQLLRTKALFFKKTDDPKKWEEALQLYLTINGYLNYLKQNYQSADATKLLNANNFDINIEIIKLCKKLNDYKLSPDLKKMAFQYAEKAKSALLLEAMRKAQVPLLDTFQQNITKLEADITYYEKKIFLESQKKTPDATLINEWRGSLFDLKRDLQTVIKTTQTTHPELIKAINSVNDSLDVAVVQQNLLQPNQTLLEYFLGDSSLFIFIVQPDYYDVIEVKKDTQFVPWIADMKEGIYGYYTLPKSQQNPIVKEKYLKKYASAAHQLYKTLIAPVAKKLTKEVIIVPDGVLGYVPFEALLTKPATKPTAISSYKYLLDSLQISYCYSATLLREMRDKQHRQAPTDKFIAFAPSFAPSAGNTASLRGSSGPLKYNISEAKALQKIMGGKIYTDTSATEARFVEEARNYRIFHFSMHGVANDSVGDYSYLEFYNVNDSIENELLYVRDLYNLQLNADLVTLSACETGIGELQHGEGIVSLARAFAYAGAKSIVTTLWSVDDERSMQLMVSFYEHLKSGKTKDAALRAAKKQFLETNKANPELRHPFFWAGFIGIGDMRAMR